METSIKFQKMHVLKWTVCCQPSSSSTSSSRHSRYNLIHHFIATFVINLCVLPLLKNNKWVALSLSTVAEDAAILIIEGPPVWKCREYQLYWRVISCLYLLIYCLNQCYFVSGKTFDSNLMYSVRWEIIETHWGAEFGNMQTFSWSFSFELSALQNQEGRISQPSELRPFLYNSSVCLSLSVWAGWRVWDRRTKRGMRFRSCHCVSQAKENLRA